MKEGWEIKKLGEICDILNGGTPDTTIPEFWNGENLWITPKDMGKMESIYIENTLRKITEDGLKNSSAKVLPVDSIILSTRAPIGHLAINKKPISTNQGCKGLVPHKGVSALYVYYFLSKSIDLLNSLGTGATFKELSGSKLGIVRIPLPSLPEQQRIVAIIDTSIAALNKAKTNAEQNLKNTQELFESYLQGVFVDKLRGDTSEKLEDLCELVVDCEHKTAPTQETGYPSIRTPNVGKGFLILENVNRVSEKTYSEWTKREVPQAGDLILAREAPAGNVAVIPENLKVCLGQRTVLIRPKRAKLDSTYLSYLLLSKDVQEQLLAHSRGATVAHINMKDIRAFKIYNLSHISEQHSIVKKLNTISAKTKKLEAIYQQKIVDLDELKKSILQKAFNGGLKTSL